MLTAQRRGVLLNRLARDGRLVASDLAAELDLSEDTIRRDLRDLAAEGRLLRVHGGALPLSPTHQPLVLRRDMATDEKRALARRAAGMIRPGMTVIVDGGTTNQALIPHLAADLVCTIVTHSPAFAAALEPLAHIDIILIGGRVFRHSIVATGAVAQEAYSRLRADLCLLGVTGLHPATGLTTGDAEEAALKATMTRAAGEVVVLATQDKLGVSSPWGIAPLSGLATLVTCGVRPDWLPPGVTHLSA
jgi:DeoR/GlpR family transcriptional regulator of sugar metabolism